MKKNLIKFQFSKNKSINSISRFMVSWIFLISFFYVTPIFINFAEKNFNQKEFTNNSKNLLNNILKKDALLDNDLIKEEIDKRDVMWDIIEENNNPNIDLVRFKVDEIDHVYKQNNFILDEIRETKLVKPVKIDLLPEDMENIKSTSKKKDHLWVKL